MNTVSQQIDALEKKVTVSGKTPVTTPKKDPDADEYNKYGYGQKPAVPSNPSNTASKIIGSAKGALDKNKDYVTMKDKQALAALGNFDLGVIPGESGVAYAKDWKKISDLRKYFAAKQLTEEERALIKAMKSTFKADYVKQPFQDVIKNLTERTGIDIIIDPSALKDQMIESTTLVTLQANKIDFRTALKKILGEVGLAYILKNGIVQVVTPQVAMNTMTVQTYSISDLLPAPTPGAGMFYSAAQEQFWANQVMQMIVMTVEPQSWAINGGKGTIFYNAASRSIVVNNSAEMHLSLKAGLAGGGY
jgi:hypothetical protein